MRGSIRKRPDRGLDAYELRVFLGRDAKGRTRHRSVLVRGTKREAERALARLVAEVDLKPALAPVDEPVTWGPRTTINDAIRAWRENGWQDLSPSTTRRYLSIWRTHIEDSIGRRPIVSLGPYDVELYLRQLKSSGLSEASVRQTRAILHRACRLAHKWSRNTLPNPVADTELPEWTLAEKGDPVRSPELAEVRAILKAAEDLDHRLAAYVRLVVATGMRRGEACALRWEDVDFEAGAVRIDESVVAGDEHATVKGPKSRAGVRKVAVDAGTLEALARLRDEIDNICAVAELEREPRHFVFSSDPPGAHPPYPDTMTHAFSKIREAAGVAADIHLHSLRHFQATALDPVISEAQKQTRLGWSTVHMARHYTDGIDEEDRRAAEHIGALLGDRRG